MGNDHFVLFADILGFSQLAANNSAEDVIRIWDSEFRQTALTSHLTAVMKCGNPGRLEFAIQATPQGALQDIRQAQLELHIMSDSLIAWTQDCSPESLLILTNFTAQFIAFTAILGIPVRGGISKGQVQAVELPLNGKTIRNVQGGGVIAAHNFEAGQEWMGCAVDKECLRLFPEEVARDLLTLQGTTLTQYDVPYKQGAEPTSDVAVDWRPCLREIAPNANYEFFAHQFGRYNKPLTEGVVRKVRHTATFYEALN